MEQSKHFGGYTLVELFVSLAVFLCLSYLLLPYLSGTNTRRAVNLKTWEIKRYLEYARNLAVTRNKTVTVCIASDNFLCRREGGSKLLVFDDRDENFQWSTDESLYQNVYVGDVSVLLSASRGSSAVRYKNSGESKESGNFQVCIPGLEKFGRQVIFFYSGRIRLSHDINRDGFDEKRGSPIMCNQSL